MNIRLQETTRIWHDDPYNAASLQNAMPIPKQGGDTSAKFDVLHHMLRKDARNRVICEG